MTKFLMMFAVILFSFSCSNNKVDEAVEDIEREVCETVNGKVECAADEAKEDIKETGEELEDSVEEITN